jgi:hypothetical protein
MVRFGLVHPLQCHTHGPSMTTSRFSKLLASCLLLMPFVAQAQNLLGFSVHPGTFENVNLSPPIRAVAPEDLSSFSEKTSRKCEARNMLPLRTGTFTLPTTEPSLVASASSTLPSQTTSCGCSRQASQPALDVASQPVSLGGLNGCAARPQFSFPMLSVAESSSSVNPVVAVQMPRAKFSWRPALWQSFEFLVMEHAFRLASDSYARYLLFHKPFWNDYSSSANHFYMNRWGDGDDFLVNYIGHPLEGAVSGGIFIQNDPVASTARFGRSAVYWKSRLKAMAWASVYSAYFEIGPVLSETALGNEGGYSYIPGCGMEGKCVKQDGREYKPATNNTGWVDFIVTPTVGTGWIILEDAIEVEFVDKAIPDHHSATHNLLLAGLTPSRTMANFLAGKHPWYRPSPVGDTTTTFGPPLNPVKKRPEWKDDPRWSLGLQFTGSNLPMDWEGCHACRSFTPGTGITFDHRLTRFLWIDSEGNLYPGSGKTSEKGGAQEVLAGLKVGRSLHSWGIFSQVRPGFIRYDKTLAPGSSTEYESTTRFALDLGGIVEYYISRHSTVRLNFGVTLVQYLTGLQDPMQPPVNVLSPDYYATQGNFHIASGYTFRF